MEEEAADNDDNVGIIKINDEDDDDDDNSKWEDKNGDEKIQTLD